jgi:hypothetical protein
VKTAIIAAAGWKSAGHKDGLAGCPECFLPLGNGTTALSRTATTLAENEFKVYTVTGQIGYPYEKYVRWVATPRPPVIGKGFPWDSSPWTQERYDYAAQFGTVIEAPNPGGWTTSLDTFCVAMDEIGEENWEHLLLARGDMVIPRNCLETILGIACPFVLSFTAWHSYFLLDKDGATFLRAYMEPFRRFASKNSWLHDKNMAPDHWGTMALREVGFGIYGRDSLPAHKWTDVDTAPTYHDAQRLVSDEEFNRKA